MAQISYGLLKLPFGFYHQQSAPCVFKNWHTTDGDFIGDGTQASREVKLYAQLVTRKRWILSLVGDIHGGPHFDYETASVRAQQCLQLSLEERNGAREPAKAPCSQPRMHETLAPTTGVLHLSRFYWSAAHLCDLLHTEISSVCHEISFP